MMMKKYHLLAAVIPLLLIGVCSEQPPVGTKQQDPSTQHVDTSTTVGSGEATPSISPIPVDRDSGENLPEPIQRDIENQHEKSSRLIVTQPSSTIREEMVMTDTLSGAPRHMSKQELDRHSLSMAPAPAGTGASRVALPAIDKEQAHGPPPQYNRESYNSLEENRFITVANDPLSTFSIDVDTASYATMRRFINGGSLPPVGSIRTEEMINYFTYDDPTPTGTDPFTIAAEVGPSPFHPDYRLLRIGLATRALDMAQAPPSNLVFLIDVSGSMSDTNKLPLLKQSLTLLTKQLRPVDRVAMVVYAGSDRVVLRPTTGAEQDLIAAAIDNLESGGSTHGSSGIVTAYELAGQSFMPGGNNRVILASDGDFNVGVTSRGELQKLIEEKRDSGVYLTVLGFGMGNYHDDTMEVLADKGNGNYAYIDSLLEAKKVLVKEMSGTLFTVARDVKIQVEFNPATVGAYRLVGYENRALADEDFRDDATDAGEVGAGHQVTALYELIPAGHEAIPAVDDLKYQRAAPADGARGELATVKMRYKPLGQTTSTQMSVAVADRHSEPGDTSDDFRFAVAVAGFAALLRESSHGGDFDWHACLSLAKGAKGEDAEGYRAEFIRLVEMAELLANQ
jgi:Ca-activated chloride channel family protein